MTHKEEYDAIITNRKNNPLPEEQYGEIHHIKPKSIYPELAHDKDNLVRLTAREHFLAHYHLWLYYRDELGNKVWARKMCCAVIRMKKNISESDKVEVLATLYEQARIGWVAEMRKNNPAKRPEVKAKWSGKNSPNHRPEVKEKLRAAKLGKKRKPFSPDHIAHLKEARRKRKHHSPETIEKIRQSMRRLAERRKQ